VSDMDGDDDEYEAMKPDHSGSSCMAHTVLLLPDCFLSVTSREIGEAQLTLAERKISADHPSIHPSIHPSSQAASHTAHPTTHYAHLLAAS
jgi:hypothetical protein